MRHQLALSAAAHRRSGLHRLPPSHSGAPRASGSADVSAKALTRTGVGPSFLFLELWFPVQSPETKKGTLFSWVTPGSS